MKRCAGCSELERSRIGRRELIATCDRGGQRYRVALLDVDLTGDADASRLVDAYRRWLGP